MLQHCLDECRLVAAVRAGEGRCRVVGAFEARYALRINQVASVFETMDGKVVVACVLRGKDVSAEREPHQKLLKDTHSGWS